MICGTIFIRVHCSERVESKPFVHTGTTSKSTLVIFHREKFTSLRGQKLWFYRYSFTEGLYTVRDTSFEDILRNFAYYETPRMKENTHSSIGITPLVVLCCLL